MALVLSDTQFIVLESAKESVNLMFAGIVVFSFQLDGLSAQLMRLLPFSMRAFFLVTKKEK